MPNSRSKLLAGASGYSFKEWRGTFYPEKMKAEEMLPFYSKRLPTVEINNTFYRLPKEAVLLGWASQVPDAFTFAIKASQKITHYARLKPESAESLAFLLNNTKALGDRLGPILFQLPPNLRKDFPRLRAFLELLPAGRRYAIEFRNETWFDDEVYAALRERDIAVCVTEQPGFASPVVVTASWGYARLHKLDYTATQLGAWAKKIAALPWSDAYVYFKHDEGEGSGPPAVTTFVGEFGRSA